MIKTINIKQENNNIITIDGPAGSGKSTIAKMLAKELKLNYIDTGAMYRAITLLAIENKIDLNDEKSILGIAKKSDLKFDNTVEDIDKYTKVLLNGKDITLEIRSKKVGEAVSIVSKLSAVRKYLVNLQREMALKSPSVLEGRDTGSVVCPGAICKIYLTASIDERVERRKKQLCRNNQSSLEDQIKCEIETRDKIDSSRNDSPLIVPDGAEVIDTTCMNIGEVFNFIKDIYIKKLKSVKN
ncbi:MAG: (d)CMP kinase [Actinobacteria bacterium]|nr:(d)CMP kinase [Actinomycetota bacterium]